MWRGLGHGVAVSGVPEIDEGPVDHPAEQTLTRADLAERLHALGFSRRRSAELVRSLFDLVVEALGDEDVVKLPGFGKFEVVYRRARTARVPLTGAAVALDGRRSVAFRPSTKLREAMTESLAPEQS